MSVCLFVCFVSALDSRTILEGGACQIQLGDQFWDQSIKHGVEA